MHKGKYNISKFTGHITSSDKKETSGPKYEIGKQEII